MATYVLDERAVNNVTSSNGWLGNLQFNLISEGVRGCLALIKDWWQKETPGSGDNSPGTTIGHS